MIRAKYFFLLTIISSFSMISCRGTKDLYGPDVYVEDPSFKVVGYLSGGRLEMIDSIELSRITHLNLAFANPDAVGNLVFSNNRDIQPVVDKAHRQGVKVLVSLAGGGRPSKEDWKRVLEPGNREHFIKNIIEYVEDNDLDGVDVDIEWNLLPTIDSLYTPFVVELRKALHARGKAITTALGASHLHPAVTQESLEAYDFINVMVYDKTGPWKPNNIGPHSPYDYAEEAINFWLKEKQIPRERLVLGMPFYAWDFEMLRGRSIREIAQNNLSDAYRDEFEKTYYNGIPTIVRKTLLAKKHFNGVMFWELTQDSFNELSLLRAVDQTLKAGDCDVHTFFKDEDGDGFGDLARPYQACQAPEGYVDNGRDPDDSEASVIPESE